MTIDPALVGFLGVVVGALVTIGAEYLRTKSAAEIDAAHDARARLTHASDFQRDNLIELQEAIYRYSRVQGEALYFDQMTFRREGRTTAWPEQMAEEAREATVRLALTRSRVLSRPVRDAVESLVKMVSDGQVDRVMYPDRITDERFVAATLDYAHALTATIDIVGEHLRSYLTGDPRETDYPDRGIAGHPAD